MGLSNVFRLIVSDSDKLNWWVFVFLETLVVIMLDLLKETDWMNRLSNILQGHLVGTSQGSSSHEFQRSTGATFWFYVPSSLADEIAESGSTMKTMTAREFSHWCDRNSRVLFPVCFALANALYWGLIWTL